MTELCGAAFSNAEGVTCQLTPNHGNRKHRATGVEPGGGRWVIEWEDIETIRRLLGLPHVKEDRGRG